MRTCLVAIVLSVISILGMSQDLASSELYISIVGLNEQQKEYIWRERLPIATVFYLVDVASDDGKYFDPEVFIKRIDDKLPDPDQEGLAVIDWERHSINVFEQNNDPLEHQRMVEQFQEALCFAKALRPNVKWSFYGLPLRTYDGVNEEWIRANKQLIGLLQNFDFLAPALYIYNINPKVYDLVSPIVEKGRGDYLVPNLKYFLEVAKELDKEIYPFIWHRMNSSNDDRALRLMPLNTFRNHVQIILSSDYQGKKVDGLIWWDSQQFYHQTRNRYKLLKEEYESVDDVDKYHLELFKTYYKSISDYF